MARNHFWTDGELQRLRKLARTGEYTISELVELTQRSDESVRTKLRQMGIEPKPAARRKKELSSAQLALLSEMAAAGFSVTAMRRKLRLSEMVVRRHLAKLLGKPYRQSPEQIREKRIATIRQHLAEAPERVKNDDLRHCLAVIRANNGCGFPAYDIPPKVRVAA